MSSTPSLVKIVDPPGLGGRNPVYGESSVVQLSETTKLITVSGQVAFLPDGSVPDGLKAQMELCLDRVKTCLEYNGTTHTYRSQGLRALRKELSYQPPSPVGHISITNMYSLTTLSSGARIQDINKLQYFFTQAAWNQEGVLDLITDIALKWLQGHRPTSGCLIVSSLSQPEFLCEFAAEAIVRA